MRGEQIKPIIGISCRRMNYGLEDWMTPQQGAIQSMIDAVVAAGGAPVLIPMVPDETVVRSIYEGLDGVLLVGGGDVNPRRYGELPREPLLNPDDLLDEVEIPLVRWAAQDGKPLLGICRGHQIINVALGGSLFQDIAAAHDTTIEHNESWLKHEYQRMVHDIILTPHSRVARALGVTKLAINSLHHQSVNRLGRGLVISGVSSDGIIEAIEGEGNAYIVGVQSHPEHVAAKDTRWQNLFTQFVENACIHSNHIVKT